MKANLFYRQLSIQTSNVPGCDFKIFIFELLESKECYCLTLFSDRTRYPMNEGGAF
jgi:hypothetical protein